MQKKPLPVDVVVGENIRRHRRSKGMSQSVLAESLGVSFQQIQKYEAGTNRITVGKLFEVAYALKTPLQDLLQGADDTRESPAPMDGLSNGDIALAREFGKLKDDKVRRAIRGLMKAVARDEEKADET